MTIICGHKWTQNQRKTLKISGKKCIFTNNRLKITGFETFISIGYLSVILIAPSVELYKLYSGLAFIHMVCPNLYFS